MQGFKVYINKYLNYSEDSDEPFGCWSEEWSNTFDRIEKVNKHPDIVFKGELKKGNICFVVWVEYSHGDSFGMSSRGAVETIGIFSTMKEAQDLKNILNKKENSYYFKDSTGQEYKCNYAPWVGYFEYLDEVHIETITIDA